MLCFSLAAADEKPNASDVPNVSLVSLIATPEKYDGKYIRIAGVGYFDSKGGLNAIFLTREDKRKANGANGIFLNFDSSVSKGDTLNDKFVVAQGVFAAQNHGHLGAFAASLNNVDRLVEVKIDIR